LTRAEPIAQALRTETGSNKIELEQLDLASLKSVRSFVKRFLEKKRPLHILINNAGKFIPLTYLILY
jgi:NAD(P)-dependent dehydrogenase (short-subunit alcohol dehydrogenase family)